MPRCLSPLGWLTPTFRLADARILAPAASCNLKYRSAPEWTGKECLLNATVWGKSSQVTWGASNDLPKLHRAVSDVVRFLSWTVFSLFIHFLIKMFASGNRHCNPSVCPTIRSYMG